MKVIVLTCALLLGSMAPQMIAQEAQPAGLKHIQTAPMNGSRPVSLAALSIEHATQYPGVILLKGNVEIKSLVCLPVGKNRSSICDGEMVVRADEAEFHEDTGEIKAQGNVKITPLLHRKN